MFENGVSFGARGPRAGLEHLHKALIKREREIKVIVDLQHDCEQHQKYGKHNQVDESPTREIGARNLVMVGAEGIG